MHLITQYVNWHKNFSKAQIAKNIQYRGFLGSLLSKLAGPLMNVAVPLAKIILAY